MKSIEVTSAGEKPERYKLVINFKVTDDETEWRESIHFDLSERKRKPPLNSDLNTTAIA